MLRPLIQISEPTPALDLAIAFHEVRRSSKRTFPLSLRLILLLFVLLAACTSSGGGDPVKTVEQYLTAKAAADQKTMSGLLCSSMEADLAREASSFAGLNAKVDGLSCQLKSGTTDVVTCTGQIDAVYGTEQTSFPLTSYKVVQEDGQWKWCGEAP